MNFLSCQSNKTISDRVSVEILWKVAVAQWIASSGRSTVIVEDGLPAESTAN